MELQNTWNTQNNWEKNKKVGELTLFDFKTNKATVINTIRFFLMFDFVVF